MELASITKMEMEQLIEELSEPKFRAGQLYDWIHKKGASSFEEMSNVPKKLKEKLI